jgi:hypothetical protein
LRNVNAAERKPNEDAEFFVPSRDPRKCARFRDKITRQFEFWGAIGRKTGTQLLLIAPRAGRQAEGNTDEY